MSANFEFKNSAQKDKEVSPNQIEFGEIALNYHQTGPFLQCKDTSGRVWRIGGIIVDENAPASPAIGAWWHKPSNQHTSFFNGSNWIRVSQGSIVDSDIALGANIGVSKLAPGAPGQLIQTHPSGTLVEWVSSLDLPGTLTVNSDTVLNADTVIHGDLTVDGTVTTINTVDLSIKDKNIELGVVPTPSDAAADTGGITLKGTTDKTFNWINLTQSWTSSENLNLAFGKTYKISGIDVLSGTSLGSGVVNSSLTSVGTIGTGVWQGSAIGAAYGGTGQTSYSAGQLLIGKTDGTLGKSTLTAGSNITITNGNGTIQIAATDTNTTYTAGDGLDLTGTVFSVDLKAGSGLVIESGEIALDADLTAIAGLTGTSGFLKKTAANTWSLDTNTYLTGNQNITISGDAAGSGTTSIALTLANSGVTADTYNNSSTAITPLTVDAKGRITATGTAVTVTPAFSSITGKPTTLTGYGITDAQPLDADLTAIAGLTGTSGFLKKTATNTWSLDTNTYLTGNQSISITGDATGSGATSITLTLANSGVVAGTYNNSSTALTPFTVDAKGRITGVGSSTTITPAFASITGKPTTLAGYGITDGVSTSGDQSIAGNKSFTGITTLAGTAVNSWSASNTDIDGLIGGSTFGSLFEGVSNGHFTIGLRSNDAGDGFQVISKQAGNATYTLKCFEVRADGNASIAGTLTAASFSGNATTATSLATARTINGVPFDGTLDITIPTTLASAVTFNNGGAGAASGSTFNGSAALTVSYNTIGAPSTTGTNASGTWGINITGSSASCTGNAATSTSTATPTFVGDAVTKDDITTRTDTGFYQTSTGTTAEGWPTNSGGWHHLISSTHSNDANYFALQIASRFDTQDLYFRNTNGSGTQVWSTLLHSGNYNNYAPTLSGTGATGTWGISITGNAGTATTATSATTATNCSRQVIAGNGLSGGGALSADVTLTVGAGDGISVAATSVAVNSTVIRTTGDQTLGGNKTFSSPLLAAAGSITAPGIASSGDTNTGLWWESADKLTVVAGGARAAYFNATEQFNYGNIYITNTDDVAADATTTTRDSGSLYFRGKYWTGTTSAIAEWRIYNDVDGTGPNGILRFNWQGSTKLSVDEAGLVTATTFSGSGASLTSLNASNLSSGTIPDGRISGAYTGITAINGSGIGGTSGDWWTKIPLVSGGGAIEIGRYIDFHSTATGTTDYDVRIDCTGANALSIGATVTATGFSGSGASLTSLNASNLTSGTVPDARISGSYTGLVNLSGTGTCEFASFNGTHSGGGAGLTALNASNLSSGTVPDARISGAYTGITAINGWGIGGTSGDWWIKIPVISGGGVLEIGRYIDFHNSATGTTDYDVRIDCTGANALSIGATVTATGFSGSGASLTSLNASNISSGTIGDAYLPATISSSITGNAATATTASACSGNAASATLVSTVTNATGTGTFYIPMVNSNVAGNRQLQINTAGFGALAYNAATSTILGNISGESGSCIGNSATATRLSSSRTFQLTGDLSGSVNADLSTGFTISASVSDNSHNHDTSTLTNVTSGSYTPTLTNTANISASNVGSGNFQYQRVGNIVSVCGTVSLTPSSSTANFELRITLPIAPATFANTTQAHGVAGDDGNTINGRVVSVGSTTVVAFIGRSTTTGTSRSCGLSFSYRI